MKFYILILLLGLYGPAAFAQDHMQHDTTKKPMKHDHAQMMRDMQHDTTPHTMNMMTSQFSLDLPMNRDGSGTSWLPD